MIGGVRTSKNVTHTLIIADGIEVTKVDESLFSLDRIDEITPFTKISDYLRVYRNNYLNKNR